MKRKNARLTRMLLMIQKEQEEHNEEINNFVNDVISIRERLTDARVMSRLVPAYRQLAVQSTIPNHLYAQVFETTMLNPSEPHPGLEPQNPHPGTPRPPLRPTNPEPPSPSPVPVPITEPVNMSMPGAMPIDYTAGNPRGPHHMPSMFDQEDTRNPLPPRFKKFTREPKGHACKYCGAFGKHWNGDCPDPHQICNTKERCIVPLEHKHFGEACHWGGRSRHNHPVEDRHIKRATRRKAERRKTRNASVITPDDTTGFPTTSTSFTPMNIDVENNLPPKDSLLFSPNPVTVFDSKENFEPSKYQGPTPPPGTWGNMPWGANWDDAAKRPPSPCIFDYGREGEDPLYLHHYDRREDLLRCAEEDLPGCQLHPDNYLDEPTMAMVDAFTKQRLEM